MKNAMILLCICILVAVSISGCLGDPDEPDQDEDTLEEEEDESTLTLYRVEYSQDENFIYNFQVTDAYNAFNESGPVELWALDGLCLSIIFDSPYLRESTYEQREMNFGLAITTCRFSVDEYESPMDLSFEYITEPNMTNPFMDLDYENLTMTVQFFDNDHDARLSIEDNFQLTVTRGDGGGYYDLSNFIVRVKSYGGPRVVDLQIDYIPFLTFDDEYADDSTEGKEAP